MAKAWLGLILLAILISANGWILAAVFNLGLIARVLCSFAILLMLMASIAFGGYLALQGLTGDIRHIPDCKNNLLITLQFGPFTYTRTIPKPEN